jgi:L-ascorbate metabolism protein UlaG (beta-lactamase superfamily)
MRIEYLGHSCFYFRDGAGTTAIVDPYDATVGYEVPSRRADFTLITHGHFDHANLAAVQGRSRVIQGSGTRGDEALEVRAVLAFHDPVGGSERGAVNMMRFEMDGVRVAHLSDLGHLLDPAQVAELRPVDVALVPVGGAPYTIDAATARKVVEQLEPRAVIPMHYQTAMTNRELFPIAGVEPFLKGFRDVETIRSGVLELTQKSLPARRTVYVLTPTM